MLRLALLASAAALLHLAVLAEARYDPVRMLCAVNKIRVKSGLKPLGMHPALTKAAQRHSDDQARMRRMSHTGSDGSQASKRVTRAGYNWKSVAENVAYGYDDQDECLDKWMQSPGHRKNILGKDSTHFGSAVAYAGSKGTPYYTQNFAGDGKRHNYPVCPSGNSYGDYDNDDYGSDDYGSYGNDDYESDRSDYGSYGHDDYESERPSYGSYGHNDYESERSDYGSYGHDDYESRRPSYRSRGRNDYASRRRSRKDDEDCDSDKGRKDYGSRRAYLVRRAPEPDHHDDGSHGESSWHSLVEQESAQMA